MNWNDYEALWKRQELPVGADAGLSDLRETFEPKRRKMTKGLFVRDILEGATGLLVSSVFADVWWHVGRQGWPLALAIGLILGVSGFFLRERLRAHRLRLGADAPLLAKIEADIAELRHQRHLLLHLWSWYLAPLAAAVVIVGATLVRITLMKAPPGYLDTLREHPAALAWIVGYFVVILPVCFWSAWAINRSAVRKRIDPRLEELEKLRRDLVSEK